MSLFWWKWLNLHYFDAFYVYGNTQNWCGNTEQFIRVIYDPCYLFCVHIVCKSKLTHLFSSKNMIKGTSNFRKFSKIGDISGNTA